MSRKPSNRISCMSDLLNNLHLAAVEFDYSVLEAVYSAEISRQILEFVHEEISAEDVFESEEIKGKEDKPHITILYGIREQLPNVPKIQQVIQNHPSMSRVKWLGLAKFEAEQWDVLIIRVESPEGEELFHDFNNIYPDNANSYPDYEPHTTLAYVQKGKADKYIDKYGDIFVDDSVEINRIRFDFNGAATDFDPATADAI